MKKLCCWLTAVLVSCLPTTAFADNQHVSVSEPLIQMTDTLYSKFSRHINEVKAELDDADGAKEVMSYLLAEKPSINQVDDAFFKNKNFYCIIHIIQWALPPAGKTTQTIQAQNWYLYNQGKLTRGNPDTTPRLYGAKEATLLYIHLNKQTDYRPLYEIDIEKKTPAYITHAIALAGLFPSTKSTPATKAVPQPIDNYWAFKTFSIQYRTSDITATPKLTRLSRGATEDSGVVQKFDNEGKYIVDFSVGVPVRRSSQLNFDSTNNTVSAKEVDKTNIFAFLNLYPRPVDIKSNNVNLVPHFVGGVAIDKQPLHKIFVGTGFGPIVANFYLGALFVKQEQLSTLKPGDPATPAQLNSNLRHRYKAQIAFGLNVPVGAIIEKLKGK